MFGLGDRARSVPVLALLRRVPGPDRKAVIHALRKALEGEKIDLDHRVVTAGGEIRTLYLRAETTADGDEPPYLQGSCQDITERKRNELELAGARDEARTADAAKTAFLAAMSHELRTPLNAIIGFSEMIAGQAFGPIGQGRYVDYARNTGEAGRQMLDFVVDVLTIAQLEAGRDGDPSVPASGWPLGAQAWRHRARTQHRQWFDRAPWRALDDRQRTGAGHLRLARSADGPRRSPAAAHRRGGRLARALEGDRLFGGAFPERSRRRTISPEISQH